MSLFVIMVRSREVKNGDESVWRKRLDWIYTLRSGKKTDRDDRGFTKGGNEND